MEIHRWEFVASEAMPIDWHVVPLDGGLTQKLLSRAPPTRSLPSSFDVWPRETQLFDAVQVSGFVGSSACRAGGSCEKGEDVGGVLCQFE